MIKSQSLVAPILAADTKAAAGREFYDDGYYQSFFASTKPIIDARISDAASGVASAIVSAWEQAGKPTLKLDGPAAPVKIKK